MISPETKKSEVAGLEMGMDVQVMGTVVYKMSKRDYGFFVVDDSSGTTPIRLFSNLQALQKIKEGDLVDVFGKVEDYKGEAFIRPTFIRKIKDPNWYLVRKLELLVPGEKKVLKAIKKLDSGDGAGMEDLKNHLRIGEDQLKNDLTKVLSDGMVYEPTPGRYKVTDDGV
jgi:RPA family protein